MRTKVIRADSIHLAATKILGELREDPNTTRSFSSRNNVIYFDGWDGLGASAVLRAIARRLTPSSEERAASPGGSVPTGLGFEQVMHIDCSKWESRRALQREVAEQLKLPREVMEMFHKQDEEDDFHGVAEGSRAELQEVVREMYQRIQKLNHRFLVIFHNGGSEEIDLASCCGFPLSGYSTNKVLWTFQGRFRLKPRSKVDSVMKRAGTTDAFLAAVSGRSKQYQHEDWSYLVEEEAKDLVAAHKINTGLRSIINHPAQVIQSFLYMLKLCRRRHQSIDYDLATHGANYWICDGITRQREQNKRAIHDTDADDDGLWRAADALQCEMQLDVDYHQSLMPLYLGRCVEREPYWTSPTCGIFLLAPTRDIFRHYSNKLSVLKLSNYIFNFASLPFLYCHNLRFLWFDHCRIIGMSPDGERKEDAIHRCFQRLWVLDVRYTAGCDQILSAQMMDLMIQLRELNVVGAENWDMGQLLGRLPNIRKLRVKESAVYCSCSENHLFSKMSRMELLEFSGNENIFPMSICGPGVGNSSSCLDTVIVHEIIALKMISFRGCANLKNILLSGWIRGLHILDLSSTAVKTLDLTAATIRLLDELYLLDCEKLCAIMWPPEDTRNSDMSKLRIDTMWGSTGATGTSSSPRLMHSNGSTSEFDWYICLRNARLLVSLEPVYSSSRRIYVEISSTTMAAGASKHGRIMESRCRSDMQLMPISAQQQKQSASALIYVDTIVDHLQQATESKGDIPLFMWMWPCPDAPHLPKESCYIHIHDQQGGDQTGSIIIPDFVLNCAKIMHVQDSLSITILPSAPRPGSEWHALEWCRIERCPKLECLFGPEHRSIQYELRTLWASQLPKACDIMKCNEGDKVYRGFPDLSSLHLDFCPRIIRVLPLSKEMVISGFQYLETLEIMWCGDLRQVFLLNIEATSHVVEQSYFRRRRQQQQPETLNFPNMKRIHLHELPTLHSICEICLDLGSEFRIKISAPRLETVKIRGCWSLKHLPVVKQAVQCDCEKEWWDNLEWEDASQKNLYKPIYSKYYKKATLLRGSVLR